MKTKSNMTAGFITFLTICMISLGGCGGGKAVRPVSVMDSPEHHVKNGLALFEQGKPAEARTEFERARALNPQHSPAIAGLALVSGAEDDFEAAFQLGNQAKKLARGIDQLVFSHVVMIRLYTMQQGKKWLKKARGEFKAAERIDPEQAAPCFYMGRAYRIAGDYDRAAKLFSKVLELDKSYIKATDDEWAHMQRIERAQPTRTVIRQIAKLDKIDRADLAALLVEEMNLDKLFKNRTMTDHSPSQRMPTDYDNHALKHDIKKIVNIGIRGLEEIRIGVFQPDREVTRSDFAVTIEDILNRTNREVKLTTRLIGSRSPFRDVKNDYYAYNAIMVCTSRGIMSADLDGKFNKDAGVSGAEALLTLRKLKEQLTY